ncbi:MAG: tetratricopeptide repeat protein [Spirochaetaceae bacterium]|jgi:tetratricopeptide (TPR) repeat protein|nr:tetratricopeptide repeat protein [Spirochaetaceae bacterium]
MNIKPFFQVLGCFILGGFFMSCTTETRAAKAAEYYALGMAYFDLGKYDEAERWLTQARSLDRTKLASEYNLGRIAFETGRYEDALTIFDRILQKDPNNTMALRAAAYTRIKTGDFPAAEALYERVLALVPESADDGYNYALVLNAMNKPEAAEAVLAKYPFALTDNKDVLLLYARSLKAQHKPEAVDNYSLWLSGNSDSQVQYEFALALEENGLYARSLEEYRKLLPTLPADAAADQTGGQSEVRKAAVQFAIARLLLIADPENPQGLTELDLAVSEGYSDTEEMKKLLENHEITDSAKEGIRKVIEALEKGGEDAAEKDL